MIALAVLWIAGLIVGFFALLSIAARYGCLAASHGLACRSSGTLAGVGLLVAVITLVTLVTVFAHDPRKSRRLVALMVGGLLGLVLCYLGAQALLGTA